MRLFLIDVIFVVGAVLILTVGRHGCVMCW
jgi:hypothetical protein